MRCGISFSSFCFFIFLRYFAYKVCVCVCTCIAGLGCRLILFKIFLSVVSFMNLCNTMFYSVVGLGSRNTRNTHISLQAKVTVYNSVKWQQLPSV